MINLPQPIFKKLSLFTILAVLIFSSFQQNIALAIDVNFYSGNDILYYDPDAKSPCIGTLGSTVAGTSVEEIIWNYLVGKGLTAEQAAGVMGNMFIESKIVPTVHQNPAADVYQNGGYGNAWGLAQWDGGRRFTAPSSGILGKLRTDKPNLEKYTAESYDYYHNPDALATIPASDLKELTIFELDYLYQESQTRQVSAAGFGSAGTEWATLKLQKTVDDATVFWHNNFEVSAQTAATVLSERGGAAHGYFDKYSKSTPGSTSAASGDCGTGNADTSSIQSTIKSYAWPEFHEPDYLQTTAAYANAVKVANSKGEFIGGGINPGIDCGGFVTRVLHDSNFSPDYNSTNGTVTDSQVPWVIAHGWKKLGTGSTINVADLRAGDVVFYNWAGDPNGSSFDHTAIYAGKIDGFGTGSYYQGIASASYGGETNGTGFWRAPMAGNESPTFPGAVWYRKG